MITVCYYCLGCVEKLLVIKFYGTSEFKLLKNKDDNNHKSEALKLKERTNEHEYLKSIKT